jgi:hypothetical protein
MDKKNREPDAGALASQPTETPTNNQEVTQIDESHHELWSLVDDSPALNICEMTFLSCGLLPQKKALSALGSAFSSWSPASQRKGLARLVEMAGDDNAEQLIGRLGSCSRWACVQAEGSLDTFSDQTLTQKSLRGIGGGFSETWVRPADFAAFCALQGWEMPAHLEALASRNSEQPSRELNGSWPWGQYETNLLRELAAAANKFWVNFDSADPTTAPTNAEVEKFLIDRGVSGRMAEYMAQMLRADGLRPGPRRGSRAQDE